MQNARTFAWDKIGAWTGGACAVHCFVLSVAAAALPMLGLAGLHNPVIDWSFLGVASIVGPLAILSGYRHHRSRLPSVLYFLGIGLIVVAHTLCEGAKGGEALVSALGGCSLLAFHLLNSRMAHRAGCHCAKCH